MSRITALICTSKADTMARRCCSVGVGTICDRHCCGVGDGDLPLGWWSSPSRKVWFSNDYPWRSCFTYLSLENLAKIRKNRDPRIFYTWLGIACNSMRCTLREIVMHCLNGMDTLDTPGLQSPIGQDQAIQWHWGIDDGRCRNTRLS